MSNFLFQRKSHNSILNLYYSDLDLAPDNICKIKADAEERASRFFNDRCVVVRATMTTRLRDSTLCTVVVVKLKG